jgi:hypothetical protein
MTRTVQDLLEVLNVIGELDPETSGDFWRSQPHIKLPLPSVKPNYLSLANPEALKGKRLAVPNMYIGEKDSHPNAKPTTVNPSVIQLWHSARKDLEALGAEIIPSDFPLVTHYEDDSISKQANNILGAPDDWSSAERGYVIAKTWNNFLIDNSSPSIPNLAAIKDTGMIFPKPENYVPDSFLEVKNLIDYANLPHLAEKYKDTFVFDLPGLSQALHALEAQRKRDFQDWLTENNFDGVVFPAQGDVGKADLEFNYDSAENALRNGVKYSHGNRAIRHLGVPTVSVPMGVLEGSRVPMNLTFAGRGYEDERILEWAYAFERGSGKRVQPGLTPALETDVFRHGSESGSKTRGKRDVEVKITANAQPVEGNGKGIVQIHIDGTVTINADIEADPRASPAVISSPTAKSSKSVSDPESDPDPNLEIEIYLNGTKTPSTPHTLNLSSETQHYFSITAPYNSHLLPDLLDWSLTPLPPQKREVMVLVILKSGGEIVGGDVLFLKIGG